MSYHYQDISHHHHYITALLELENTILIAEERYSISHHPDISTTAIKVGVVPVSVLVCYCHNRVIHWVTVIRSAIHVMLSIHDLNYKTAAIEK